MKIFSFRGGIHPYEGKELSKDKPIQTIEPGDELSFPLSQHIGAPAKAIVGKGDRVLVGQKIAEADGFVSVPIYATVSGTVRTIEPRRTVSGNMVDSIIVTNDYEYESVEFTARDSWEALSREEIIECVRQAGIVGMGGAGFPTHVKLSPKNPDDIQYVITNCAECEPYLTSDYRRMLEEPEKIVLGLRIATSLFPHATGLIGIENNKMDCVATMMRATKEYSNIRVCVCETKYPQGAERQLIYALTKRELNSKMLPADAGCVVLNADTLYAIAGAVCEGRPLMHRIVTVTGDAIAEPQNFKVALGTSYAELVEHAGGFVKDPVQIISGGPMMGHSLFDLNVPVMKASSALLCLTKDQVAEHPSTACIRCGKCMEVCPEKLMPAKLATLASRGNYEEFEKLYGLECVECGSCSYICPARRQLAHAIRAGKRTVLAQKKR